MIFVQLQNIYLLTDFSCGHVAICSVALGTNKNHTRNFPFSILKKKRCWILKITDLITIATYSLSLRHFTHLCILISTALSRAGFSLHFPSLHKSRFRYLGDVRYLYRCSLYTLIYIYIYTFIRVRGIRKPIKNLVNKQLSVIIMYY